MRCVSRRRAFPVVLDSVAVGVDWSYVKNAIDGQKRVPILLGLQ
jgi:hypothetical protein